MVGKFTILGLAAVLAFMPAQPAGAEWNGPWPDTGQTVCYDNTGEIPCPQPGEPFYGQDAQYQGPVRSYTKLGHGGVKLPDNSLHVDDGGGWIMTRDNVTGLIWELKTNANRNDSYTWSDAFGFVNSLNTGNFGGFSDWRIPDVKELSTLVQRGHLAASNWAWFPKTWPSRYWSSTTLASYADLAWLVYFGSGHADYHVKSSSYYVRAVRAGQPGSLDNLAINGDGTVTDTQTGLMWQKATAPGQYTWQQALSYTEGLSLAGHSDWRLPNRYELLSLVDYSSHNPAIDPLFASNTWSSHYWSSTTYAGDTHLAWRVSFGSGLVDGNDKSNSCYVRAVRAGQNRLLGHLFILSPTQGSKWNRDDVMPITWDTADIEGNVKVSLSRDGGKIFETIAEETPNSGIFEWLVTGPESVNCMIEIVPLVDPSKKTIQGLFSIPAISYTLSYTAAGGGSITGETTQIVDPDSDGTAVEAVPDKGYYFVKWSDGRTDNPRIDTNVDENLNITAIFHILGDVNADNRIDLADVILALQVLSGMTPSVMVHSDSDVDGGGKIGLTEAIYVLQMIGKLRDAEKPEPVPNSFSNSLGMTFNLIPAGTFMMGSPSNEPGRWSDEFQHQVTLTKDYFMQTTEVTQGQWKAVMGSNPSHFSDCGDNCPVEMVSWNDVERFIIELNKRGEGTYRLPTEAEWEYAARAGTTTPFHTGNCLSTDQANYDGNLPLTGCSSGVYREKTLPVGSFAPNAWGIYDMHGNVWEWVQDRYGTYPTGTVTDPTGPSWGSLRVFRGGSWYDGARCCRSALRDYFSPGTRFSAIGFRLVLPQVP